MPRLRPAVQMGLALGVAAVGLAFALKASEEPVVTAEAYTPHGRQLIVDCRPARSSTGRVRAWRITASNSIPELITATAHVKDQAGEGLSNEVTTEVNSRALDVTIHLHVRGGVFVSGRQEHGDSLVVEIGDMAFGEEKNVSAYVRR